ncbi:MAG: 4Fe-4S binding protein [Bacillota bacterium]
MVRITIHEEFCKGCDLCQAACPKIFYQLQGS